jgi:membrane protease YdiL (CAAX protease family)
MGNAVDQTSQSVGRKIVATAWAALLAFAILIVGQAIWGGLLEANFRNSPRAVPWSVPAMAVVLWAIWKYLGGSWWPPKTSQARRRARRANPVSATVFLLSFLAGALAMAALAGCWIVFLQLAKTPANALGDPSKYPWFTIVPLMLMSSLVSPIVEEIAFRGYCQQILERHFSGTVAVLISSLLFMLAHANHGWYWTKLSVYFLAGIVFGAIARLTHSILTSLPVHIFGDLTFFTLIWPRDASRLLVSAGGADQWFWAHVVQAVVFTVLAILVFGRLAKLRADRGVAAATSPSSARIVDPAHK